MGVVPGDVPQDFVSARFVGVEFEGPKRLDRWRREEPFCQCVIQAVTLADHAVTCAGGLQHLAVAAA